LDSASDLKIERTKKAERSAGEDPMAILNFGAVLSVVTSWLFFCRVSPLKDGFQVSAQWSPDKMGRANKRKHPNYENTQPMAWKAGPNIKNSQTARRAASGNRIGVGHLDFCYSS
jgi:hypothetical protein